MSFVKDTAVSKTDDPNTFTCNLSERWKIWGPNGGYLSAIALRAVESFANNMLPISLHTQYLRVAKFEAVELQVTEIRRGRSVANYNVVMIQGGKPIISTTIVLGKAHEGMNHDHAQTVKSFSENITTPDFEPNEKRSPFWNNFNIKPVNWGNDVVPGEPVSLSWFEFVGGDAYDNAFHDYSRSVILIDTMLWPAAHNVYETELGFIAPSLDLYVKFHRSSPDSNWLYCKAQSPLAEGGLINGDAQIFDEDGQLVASGGSQMYCQKLP